MYLVRLNDITIKIDQQNVYVFDIFHDLSDAEIRVILKYLAEEGFLRARSKVNVFVQNKPFLPNRHKKESKKKN